jgi:hypothetical protein
MTQDDIIRMAKEAGFADGMAEIMGLEGFYNFAALVAAHEREECAKLCKNEEATLLHKEGLALPQGNPMLLKMASVANFCAAAIRARGEQEQTR